MKQYIGTKIINAVAMTRQEYNDFRGWQLPADENGADAGYLVEYLDGGKPNTEHYAGYVSWSPAEQFEKAYRPMNKLNFGDALHLLQRGYSVARSGWNGKGMFVYLVPAASYPARTGAAKQHFGESAMVPYNAYFAIKNANETVSTWVPSVNDCLADDWHLVD